MKSLRQFNTIFYHSNHYSTYSIYPSSREVLQIHNSSGIFDPGAPNPKMVGCICIVYFMLYISLFKGVKSSGELTGWCISL